MNVFELAQEYRALEALADGEAYPEVDLLEAWLEVEGDFNAKLENIGFLIKNREATLAGKQAAITAMEETALRLEKDIERLKAVALHLLRISGKPKAGGQYLTLSAVGVKARVDIEDAAKLPREYLREIPAVPASLVPDKTRLYEDLKEGVIIEGARLVPGVRLAIK